jgi:hypothetical protein
VLDTTRVKSSDTSHRSRCPPTACGGRVVSGSRVASHHSRRSKVAPTRRFWHGEPICRRAVCCASKAIASFIVRLPRVFLVRSGPVARMGIVFNARIALLQSPVLPEPHILHPPSRWRWDQRR